MRTLLSIIFAASLALTMQAQDVTNTLGTDGNFKVSQSDATNLFTLSSTSNGAHLLRLAPGTTSAFNVLNSAGNPVIHFSDAYSVDGLASMIIGSNPTTDWTGNNYAKIQLQSNGIENIFSMITYGNSNTTTNEIRGYRGRGTKGTPVQVDDGDILLNIKAFGDTDFGSNPGSYKSSEIVFKVDGSLTGSYPPGKIEFLTSDGITTGGGGGTTGDGEPEVRMTIKNDGKVGIGTETPASTLDVDGSMSLPIRNVIAQTTLDESDYTVTASGADFTVFIPQATSATAGRVYVIKHGGGGPNTITVDVTGSGTSAADKIDNSLTQTLATDWSSMMIQSTGETWIIIGRI